MTWQAGVDQGLDRLVYTEKVGGSNPSSCTHFASCTNELSGRSLMSLFILPRFNLFEDNDVRPFLRALQHYV